MGQGEEKRDNKLFLKSVISENKNYGGNKESDGDLCSVVPLDWMVKKGSMRKQYLVKMHILRYLFP